MWEGGREGEGDALFKFKSVEGVSQARVVARVGVGVCVCVCVGGWMDGEGNTGAVCGVVFPGTPRGFCSQHTCALCGGVRVCVCFSACASPLLGLALGSPCTHVVVTRGVCYDLLLSMDCTLLRYTSR